VQNEGASSKDINMKKAKVVSKIEKKAQIDMPNIIGQSKNKNDANINTQHYKQNTNTS